MISVEDANMLDGKVDDGICFKRMEGTLKLLPAGTGQMVFYETFVYWIAFQATKNGISLTVKCKMWNKLTP